LNRERWQRLQALVDRAADWGPAERRDLLAELAANDPEVGRDLAAYWAAEVNSDGFLEQPVEAKAAPLLDAIGRDPSSWEELQLTSATVGPYRLLRELGRGGMGAVFLAERIDGEFERRVALKLVKRELADERALARFRAERQILARLEHPNIARLLDGGASATGQPYFAMELVEGVSPARYCDERRAPVAERLRLFLQICDAVDFAHRNLVVHRDLKPSNLLITADGQAKLLDFGIAKVLEPVEGTDEATLTVREARALTPQYAAPEQILGRPVTTATDVYSLGIVLHELLSGRHPFPLSGSTRGDLERLVLEGEPELASSTVRRAERQPAPTAEAIAAARGVSVERLIAQLRGDLDNVLRKALRKEPERRYPSAAALANDLRHVLAGEPVSARPDTFGYRAAKFVRRHRFGVVTAALVVSTLAGGVAATLWQAREALAQARKAEEVKSFVFGLFAVADPDVAKGKEISARQLLERATERIRSELAGQPEVEAEMLLFVGNIHHRIGLDRESSPLFQSALDLRRQLFGPSHLAVHEAEVALAGARFEGGELEEAERLYAAALAGRERLLGEAHPDTAKARGLLGRVTFERGDLDGSAALLRRAISDQRRVGPSPDAELAANLNALGRALHAQGDLDGAEANYREALTMRRALFGEEHTVVSEGMLNLATVASDRGDRSGAEAQYRAVLANDRRLFGDTHGTIAHDLNNLGTALVSSRKCAEAQTLLSEAVAVYTRLYGPASPQLAVVLHNLSRASRCLGQPRLAEAQSRDALARASAMLGEHPNVDRVRQNLARILGDLGRLEEGEALGRRAVAGFRKALPADHPWLADGLVGLGHLLTQAHRAAEAEPLLLEATAILEKRFGAQDWRAVEGREELNACRSALQAR
jgi:serine/threonine protein kinase/Tfp pilus assembly protein PilF